MNPEGQRPPSQDGHFAGASGSTSQKRPPSFSAPPVPFQQFEYSFPPQFPEQLLPPTSEQPSGSLSNSLLSAAEQNHLLGFLDNFEWQFDPLLPPGVTEYNTDLAKSDEIVPAFFSMDPLDNSRVPQSSSQ